MVKPILVIYPMLPTASEAERVARRPVERDRALYQRVLVDWHDVVRAADEEGMQTRPHS